MWRYYYSKRYNSSSPVVFFLFQTPNSTVRTHTCLPHKGRRRSMKEVRSKRPRQPSSERVTFNMVVTETPKKCATLRSTPTKSLTHLCVVRRSDFSCRNRALNTTLERTPGRSFCERFSTAVYWDGARRQRAEASQRWVHKLYSSVAYIPVRPLWMEKC